jgi:hypothetical protein
MPWIRPMEQKKRFVEVVASEVYDFAEVCRQFGISRKSG